MAEGKAALEIRTIAATTIIIIISRTSRKRRRRQRRRKRRLQYRSQLEKSCHWLKIAQFDPYDKQ